ncbi:unnamed protein product [Aureobasidium vineae]|uniref:Only prolin and serin are matching in the corresponding protein n=1 Tax=Aureobasidium vineae TaxID=2773715 RepID=A0A9N8PHW2_9PEZI|nr:unnamed protein product [Aureobasidium vineae]
MQRANMRPSMLPKLIVAQTPTAATIGEMVDSPYSMHSRNSSGTSDNYSPLTQTFSFHEHTRQSSSSSSSVASTPPKYEPSIESLNNRVSRTTLHDLVEDPHEREDGFDLCDRAFESNCQCGLEQTHSNHDMYYLSEAEMDPRLCQSVSALERPSLDYSLADGPSDFNSDSEFPLQVAKSRSRANSGESSVTGLASRVGSRLSSFSKRRDRTPTSPPTTAVHRLSTKSAPVSRVPSRASSFRMSSVAKPVLTPLDVEAEQTPTPTPANIAVETSNPLDIQIPEADEPIDRKALASTPLLPRTIQNPEPINEDVVQSPLQSPTVVDNAQIARLSMIGPSLSSPILPEMSMVSPALSAHTSTTSLGAMHSSQVMSSPDISTMHIVSPQDKWAEKLGHANFNVFPEPYLPETYNIHACRKLFEDWESARRQFMHQAARTSEHYGPTSQVYKYTEKKWAEIDAQWKRNHELVVAKTAANGETPVFQPLAEPAPLTDLPALDDPLKFPKLDGSDIVGPMVKYAQIKQKSSSKKSAFLKFFNSVRTPGNTLGRTPTGLGL